jgi:hypothetical protein
MAMVLEVMEVTTGKVTRMEVDGTDVLKAKPLTFMF